MENIKTNQIKLTQKQQNLLNNYNNAKYDNLRQAYKTCSDAKIISYQNILDEMRKNNGYNMRITGANSCVYSCAYKYQIFNDDNIITKLVYHTHANKYEFIINITPRNA